MLLKLKLEEKKTLPWGHNESGPVEVMILKGTCRMGGRHSWTYPPIFWTLSVSSRSPWRTAGAMSSTVSVSSWCSTTHLMSKSYLSGGNKARTIFRFRAPT